MLLLVFLAIGCSKDDDTPAIVESGQKQITSFIFDASDNAALSDNSTATINEAEKTILANMPAGTDITSLTPEIVVSEDASVRPVGAQDFSAPVTYTVTAEDGSSVNYTATVDAPVIANSNPLAFNLVTVPDNAVDVDVLPIFSWNAAVDPDGDTVVYDIYLSEGTGTPNTLYIENLSENSLQVTERLALEQDYAWVVVAKDTNGGNVSSATRTFSTRALRFNEAPEIANAAFTGRFDYTSVVFQDQLWVIGGAANFQENLNDVWVSPDGVTWSEVADGEFPARNGHSSVVFDNRIWIIGGTGENGQELSDVWSSEDGITWKEMTLKAEFGGRARHTSVVFDNRVWLIGGIDETDQLTNDVWVSEDGIFWKEATPEAKFSPRAAHSSVVFEDAIYVIGGQEDGLIRKNDVYKSEDGAIWEVVTDEANFTGRRSHSSIVFDNKLWVIGGLETNGDIKNDAWFSTDGNIWTEATGNAPFSRRYGHTSVVFDNKAWVISGIDEFNGRPNDVWTFE